MNDDGFLSNKKIAAFDLDGTLTESKQPLEKDMAEVLKRLSEKVIVGVISGGSYERMQKQFLPFIDFTNLVLLPANGSQCYEFNDGEWKKIFEEKFDDVTKKEIFSVFKEIETSGNFDIPKEEERMGNLVEDRGSQITFSAFGQNATIEKKKGWDDDQEKRKKIIAVLNEKVEGIEAVIGGMTSIDILPKGFNKAAGLLKFLNNKGLEKSDMVFVGDAVFPGGNDYSPMEAGIETIKVLNPENTKSLIEEWLL